MRQPIAKCKRKIILEDIQSGASYREVAKTRNVSIQAISDLVKQYTITGDIEPRDIDGCRGQSKISSFSGWLEATLMRNPDLSCAKLAERLYEDHGVNVNRVSIWRYVQRNLGQPDRQA